MLISFQDTVCTFGRFFVTVLFIPHWNFRIHFPGVKRPWISKIF